MRLPLLFTFSQAVFGNGFIAAVQLDGHAILDEDWGEVWISGVAPAGFAGGGNDRATALVDFKQRWALVLFDIAAEAKSYADFHTRCAAFLNSRAPTLDSDWDEARAQIKANGYEDDSLQRVDADTRPFKFVICELQPQQSAPAKNAEVVVAVALAAA